MNYLKMIDACRRHSLEDMIPPFPKIGDEGITTKANEFPKRKKWVFTLARILMQERVDDCDSYFMSAMNKYHVEETERCQLANLYSIALNIAKYPIDAPEQLFKQVTIFEKYWGEIPAPRWCKRAGTPYKRLWLAVAMLGANGNIFQFACVRMSKAFDIKSPQTVNGFLVIARKEGLIKVVNAGASYSKVKGGTAARYQIANARDYSMIRYIVPDRDNKKASPFHNDSSKKQKFWEYVAKELPWLGIKES